jgi:hypothetical protein
MSNELLNKKFKAAVNNKIENLTLDLILFDGFLPHILFLTEDDVEEFEVNFDETPKEGLLHEYASRPNVKAVALIFIADTLNISKRKTLPLDIAADPENMEAIVSIIHTKEGSELRRKAYKRKGEKNYLFFDEGWEPAPNLTGRFSSPYKS